MILLLVHSVDDLLEPSIMLPPMLLGYGWTVVVSTALFRYTETICKKHIRETDTFSGEVTSKEKCGQMFPFQLCFPSLCIHFYGKKVREKPREYHNHKQQPFPDTKRKRKRTNPNKHKSNKRTKST